MPNRLAGETSPYLLQHASNPVDWYPWGAEAFAKAKVEDKPLLLSVGYAACHWCHVMERESFEDPETALLMNDRFVSVKVDREERPDVDSIYMGAVQALTGQGGWPMTVFCTPDGVPFLGGTYFPPEDRHGLPSFRTVLQRVDELWRTRRGELVDQGQRIVDAITRSAPASNEPLQATLIAQATGRIVATHDSVHGGFGGPPKFPQAPVLEFLLRSARRSPSVREALDRTLRAMALGGIYDQLGGGFARYSVDNRWTVPHFEKMLYDNTQLARVYLHAWQAFGDDLYRRIATETLEYLLADMRDAAGGFHSSEDADSEGEEGTFYVWSYDEFMTVAPEAADYYGVTHQGNFEGSNILTAGTPDPRPDERAKLLAARKRRERPGKDDKVLASWNGLAIGALAEVGAALGRTDFVDAAGRAATFVLEHMTDEHSDLLHAYRGGRAHVRGLLEDYAYLADGLYALWEATFKRKWLDESVRLVRRALELFGDASGGGFYTAPPGHDLIVRQKEIIESATPAPGGVMALLLQKLAVLFDDPDMARAGVDALRHAHVYMDRAPQAVATWLSALDFYVSTPTEIAFTGPPDTDDARDLTDVVRRRFLPNRVIAGGVNASDLALLRDRPEAASPTAYVCEHYVCKEPATDSGQLVRQLDGAA